MNVYCINSYYLPTIIKNDSATPIVRALIILDAEGGKRIFAKYYDNSGLNTQPKQFQFERNLFSKTCKMKTLGERMLSTSRNKITHVIQLSLLLWISAHACSSLNQTCSFSLFAIKTKMKLFFQKC